MRDNAAVRAIPDPGFAGDDGSVPPQVAAAMREHEADPVAHHQPTLAVLQDARLLVPVVAVLGEVEYDEGLARDKSADMATVLMRGRDGRLGLLAFTGQEPLRRWKPDARPVPVTTRDAARAAVQEQADALLVDVAGPSLLVVEGEELHALAAGKRLVRSEERWLWLTGGRPAAGAEPR